MCFVLGLDLDDGWAPGRRGLRRRSFRAFRALACATLLGFAMPAAAQLREGVYDLAGRTPDGGRYDGAVLLRPGAAGTWLVAWQVGNARVVGIGVVQGGVLAVAFEVQGAPGVAAFAVDTQGKLQGSWSTGAGLGTEVLTPRASTPP